MVDSVCIVCVLKKRNKGIGQKMYLKNEHHAMLQMYVPRVSVGQDAIYPVNGSVTFLECLHIKAIPKK
jgi:hypothetical protein